MKKILLNNLKYALLIIVIIIGFNVLSPQKSLAGYVDNWTYNTSAIVYTVVVPAPGTTITANYIWPILNIDMLQQITVRWNTANYSPTTSCKGSFTPSTAADPSYDFIGDGRRTSSVGVNFTKSENKVYTVTCINSFTPTVGACSGTYTVIGGVCGYTQVAGSVGAGGELPGPYEGDLCSSLPRELCGAGWITHGCSNWTPSTTTASCSGLSQVSCLNKSECTWSVVTP